MRLLHFQNGQFVFPKISKLPPYVILSHTWSENDEDEVSYGDIVSGEVRNKSGLAKLLFCRDRAVTDGYEYFWIDTCCIDKSNDAETVFAIRSMYRWYRDAAVCYVYLSDVSAKGRSADGQSCWEEAFRRCRWFTRGWTLQELLAPKRVKFFARDGYLGDKVSLQKLIHGITEIPLDAILDRHQDFSRRERLDWARKRQTKKPEDMSYCMAGICDVNMASQYGEGAEEARRRLENKILKRFGFNELDSQFTSNHHTSSRDLDADDLDQQRKDAIKRLKFEAMESRRDTIRKPMAKTCAWILSHPAYLAWTRPKALQDNHGFFWIKGKPGAGKSVVVKFIDYHFAKNLSENDIRLSFYFNARGEPLEKTFLGLYRSLLAQLMTLAPELRSVLDILDTINTFDGSKLIRIQRAFSMAISQIRDRYVWCFIDALDECRGDDVQNMIDFFQELQTDALNHGQSFRVCFASRHYPLVDVPTKLHLVLEDDMKHANDLRGYIEDNMHLATSTQLSEVKDILLQKANGIFLWVVLVVQILKKELLNGRGYALVKCLNDIPTDPMQLFDSILKHDHETLELTSICLRWILYAMRPLSLPEFYFAMMAAMTSDNCKEVVDYDVPERQMHAFLLSSSKGLAELTKGASPTVQFIHKSVRDFLLTDDGLKHLNYGHARSRAESHDLLKQYCINCLRDEGARKKGATWFSATTISSEHPPTEQPIVRNPFQGYVKDFILYHSNEAALQVQQYTFLEELYESNRGKAWKSLRTYYYWIYRRRKAHWANEPLLCDSRDQQPTFAELAYIFAHQGHVNLLTTIADRGHSLTMRTELCYGTPLIAAIAVREFRAVKVILECSGAADVDQMVNDIRNVIESVNPETLHSLGQLRWAIAQGSEALPTYFITISDDYTISQLNEALWEAARRGSNKVIRALLENGANINAEVAPNFVNQNTFDLAGFALHIASARGHAESVRCLLNSGADINAEGGYHWTALQAASANGHVEVAKLLLEKGADFNLAGGHYGCALQAASAEGRLEIVQLLLEKRADIDLKGGRFGSALRAAMLWGHDEIVELLERYKTSWALLSLKASHQRM